MELLVFRDHEKLAWELDSMFWSVNFVDTPRRSCYSPNVSLPGSRSFRTSSS